MSFFYRDFLMVVVNQSGSLGKQVVIKGTNRAPQGHNADHYGADSLGYFQLIFYRPTIFVFRHTEQIGGGHRKIKVEDFSW